MAAQVRVGSREHDDGFVPVRVGAGSGLGTAAELGNLPASPSTLLAIAPRPAERCGAIEIELSGARIRVEPGVDATTLSAVLSALRGAP